MTQTAATQAPLDAEPLWTPRMPLSVRTSSALMQDVMSGDPLRPSLSKNTVALFANPFKSGQTEALVILDGGELVHLERSAAGWVLAPVDREKKTMASEVIVAISPKGVVWGLYIARDARTTLTFVRLAADGWKVVSTGQNQLDWSNIKLVYTPPTPVRIPVVYGSRRSSNDVLKFSYLDHGGNWCAHWAQMPSDSPLPNADISLYPAAVDSTANSLPTRFRMTYVHRDEGRYFEISKGLAVVPSQSWDVKNIGNLLQGNVVAATAAPIDRLALGVLSAGIGQDVHFGVFYSIGEGSTFKPFRIPLPGVPYFEQSVTFFDANQLAHVYGIDGGRTVSVLHQTGWEQGTLDGVSCLLPTWTKGTREDTKKTVYVAVPFTKEALRLHLDPFPDSSPTLLVVHWNSQQSDIGDLTLYTQDLLTGRWSIEPVRLASGARQVAVPCYRTQATLVDASGVPVPDYAMRLTARSYVQVNIAGTAHLLTPGSAVEIKTDRLGRAIFSTLAYGLTTPSLVLNAPALPDGVVIKPDGPVQNYLAGTGILPLRPKLTGEVLRDAGVVPSWDGKPSPNDVVASIEDLFKAAAAKPLRSRNAGFMIQTFDPSRPAYRTFASREELTAELALHRRHDLYGGLFDDLKMGLEDLWEGIKSGAAKIKQAVFDAVEGTIRFFIWIGGKVVELYKTVVQSFRDAADATMALFNQLDATIQSVVSWLQSMFNFKDIWDTKTALEVDGLKRFPDYIRAELLAKMPPASIKNHLNEYRAKALDGLQAFAKRFAGQKFQDLPGWSQLLSAQNHGREALLFSSPQGTVRRTDIDNPQANWFLDSLLPYDAFVPEGPMVPSLEPAWAELRNALDKLDFSFAYEFKDRLVNLFDPKNADALGSIVLDAFVALLTWTLDKLFDLAIAIVEALFKVVDKTLQAMAQFLDTQVEFQPILDLVTWVYKQAHSKEPNPPPPPPVTLAGLVSLVVAFPATLAWKLAVGDPNRPLFPDGKLPQPGRGLTSGAETDGQRCLVVGGVIQAYYMFLDCANDTEPTHSSSVGAIVMELLMPMLIWPTPEGVPFTSKSSEEPLQQFFRWFNWAPGLIYVASDALFYLIGWNGKKQLARQVEPLGIMVLFSFGTINLIAGVGESVVTQPTVTGAGIAANVLSPLSPAAQILRISGRPNPYALAIKLAINVFSDVGGGIARGLAAVHSVP